MVVIAPENLEVANAYLSTGSIVEAAAQLHTTPDHVQEILAKSEVKRYVDEVYLDAGYRNRFKLGELMDRIIASKLEEAEETGIYSNKDLVDILALVHKMTVEQGKYQQSNIKTQTNVQINAPFGEGNYGELMKKLLSD